MFPGVRPIICLAAEPTATTLCVLLSIATTEGSESKTPHPLTYTSVRQGVGCFAFGAFRRGDRQQDAQSRGRGLGGQADDRTHAREHRCHATFEGRGDSRLRGHREDALLLHWTGAVEAGSFPLP